MNAKNFLATTLGAATHFFLGFIIYGLLLMDYRQANTATYEGLMKEGNDPITGYVLSSILFAVMITYILSKVNSRTSNSGMMIAGTISLLISASLNVMFYFSMNLYSGMAAVVDVIAYTIMGAVTGWVIGFMLNRKKSVAAQGAAT